jgi:hypothetical protein
MPRLGNQPQVDLEALVHRGIGQALGHALAVGFGGDVLAELGQVILAVGLLDMGEELRPLAPQVDAAPQEIAGRPQLGR